MQTLCYALAALCTLFWLRYLFLSAYHGSAVGLLRLEEVRLRSSPKISIIIAARNEALHIDRSLRSILKTSYTNLEVIVVNDRSTDATGAILETLAQADDRVKAIHIDDLPSGWLGKVHALHTGTSHATGEWLLFTDADIHFEPEVLTRSITYAEAHSLDQLSVLPDDRTHHRSFFLPLFVFAFGGMFLQRLKVRQVNDGKSGAFVGVGAFNLIRRSAFERTPGFEWLRMEVVDDVGVGYMIAQIGGRSRLLHGDGLLSFEWYQTLREAINGLEKNAFAGFARYSVLRGMLAAFSQAAIVLLPFIITLALHDIPAFIGALLLYSVIPGLGVLIFREGPTIKPQFAACLPLGFLFVAYAIFNSTMKGWKDHGLRWRDTFYSLEELRKGRRVDL